MLTIGEFAQASGLTAKALRFYDEVGLLVPAEVDPATGYRRYTAGQLRTAATVRLLRATAMPLNEVRTALDSPDRMDDLRRAYAERVAAERERQDRAMAVADRMLKEFDEKVEVLTREVPEQHWIGAVMTGDPTAEEPSDTEAYQERFALLAQRLAAAGHPLSGPWWTVCLPEGTDQATMLLCWELDAPAPDGFAMDGLALRTGLLPARVEAYVRYPRLAGFADLPDLDGEGFPVMHPVLHPAYVAYVEYREEHGLDTEEIRSTCIVDEASDQTTIDVSVTTAVR